MPLPEKAFEYLDYAVMALKPAGGWIHYYDFEHASKNENPIEKVKKKISEKLQDLGVESTISCGRVVRPTGPNWYLVVLDIQIHKNDMGLLRKKGVKH
jgi:tRNA G37 N-methylase Trm5